MVISIFFNFWNSRHTPTSRHSPHAKFGFSEHSHQSNVSSQVTIQSRYSTENLSNFSARLFSDFVCSLNELSALLNSHLPFAPRTDLASMINFWVKMISLTWAYFLAQDRKVQFLMGDHLFNFFLGKVKFFDQLFNRWIRGPCIARFKIKFTKEIFRVKGKVNISN